MLKFHWLWAVALLVGLQGCSGDTGSTTPGDGDSNRASPPEARAPAALHPALGSIQELLPLGDRNSSTLASDPSRSILPEASPGAALAQAPVAASIYFPDNLCATATLLTTAPFVSGVTPVPNGTTVPYPLCTAQQYVTLINTETLWSSNFELMADIDLGTLASPPSTTPFAFGGVFEGNNRTLSNYTMVGSAGVGVLGKLGQNGVIRNLVLRDFNVSGFNHVGGLVRENRGLIEHVTGINLTVSGSTPNAGVNLGIGGVAGINYGTLSNVTASVNVTGSSDAYTIGGLVGRQGRASLDLSGFLVDSSVSGSVTRLPSGADPGSTSTGGAVGLMEQGGITNVHSAVSVVSSGGTVGGLVASSRGPIVDSSASGPVTSAGHAVGGLVGVNNGILESSFSTSSVSGTAYVGGLVGIASDNSNISDSHATGNVEGTVESVGGLCGRNSGAISTSYATGVIEGVEKVGGLVGHHKNTTSTVIRSWASGAISASGRSAGGLIGVVDGQVDASYARGAVSGADRVGGLVGHVNAGGSLEDCASTANTVSGDARVGGLVGLLEGSAARCFATGNVSGNNEVGGLVGTQPGSVTDSYATGDVTASVSAGGGLVGELREGGTVVRAYAAGAVQGIATLGGFVGEMLEASSLASCHFNTTANSELSGVGNNSSATGVGGDSASALRQQATFSGWNFTTTWGILEGRSFPFLDPVPSCSAGGCGLECPCPPSECTSDADCESGQVCGDANGLCWDPICESSQYEELCGADGPCGECDEDGGEGEGPAEFDVVISLPADLRLADVALAASQELRLGDRSKIKAGTVELSGKRFSPVVSTGGASTTIGESATLGDVWSKPSVTLGEDATVEGDARSEGTITLSSGAEVTGVEQAELTLGPLKDYSFTVQFPGGGDDVSVESSQDEELAPGSYGATSIEPNATLFVEGGTYYFDELRFEPGSRLILNDAEPVVFNVRGDFTWNGRAERESDATAQKLKFLVVALGSGSVPIASAFHGTVIAPNATLQLQLAINGDAHDEHWGSFFGEQVQVDDDVVINHHRFPWKNVLPVEPIQWVDPSTVLKPVLSEDGQSAAEAEFETPIYFEVPDEVWVDSGNAGNGTLTISVRVPGQAEQICTYQGGSDVAHPTTDFDRAQGLRYLFPECTGDIKPGGKYLVDRVAVEVVSADPEASDTSVSIPIGPGCHETLPPPMTPEEVVATREDFDWLTIDSLPETDPEGNPALWHALIYIDNVVGDSADPPVVDQLQALDLWRVYYSTVPLSRTYVDKLAGKCGRVTHATDGKGVVVYAVLPARLFNILRAFSIEARLAGVEPPFKFIMPSTPSEPEYVNSDGSLRYAALSTSGYADWLAALPPQQPGWRDFTRKVKKATKPVSDGWEWVDNNLIDPVTEAGQEGFSYVEAGWDHGVDYAANGLDDLWEQAQILLGDLLPWSKRVELELNFDFANRDTLLQPNTKMMRMWGDRFSAGIIGPIAPDLELIPRGARVRVRQWGWGFLPVMFQAPFEYSATDANGKPSYDMTRIEVLRDDDGRGDGALCVELDTPDGMLTTDLIPNEVCDFGLGLDDIPTDPVIVSTSNRDLHALVQISDSADYARQVIQYEPHKVDVLIGPAASGLTGLINFNFINPRAATLCLDFPGVGAGILNRLLGAASPIALKDMWWPRGDQEDSRGVMTHEYGHFLMCSLMYDHDGASALTALMERISEGQDNEESDDVALATESIADTFTMQVVGGSNYVAFPGSRGGGHVAYCQGPPCAEANYANVRPNEFISELARYQSLIHDAFDRSSSGSRLKLEPWNGDVWAQDLVYPPFSDRLEFSPSGYIAYSDEDVQLPGPKWQNWIEHYTDESGAGVHALMRALSLAMEDNDDSWCNRCDLFMLHEGSTPDVGGDLMREAASSPTERWNRWKRCTEDTILEYELGAAPEPYLNIDQTCQVCGERQYVDLTGLNGQCTLCPNGEVARGDHCEPCDPGTIPAPGNQCVSCGSNEISVNGACVACGPGEAANRDTNTCDLCPADVIIDWRTVPIGDCWDSAEFEIPVDYTSISPPGDLCPDDLWFEVTHLDEALARGSEFVQFDINPDDPPADQLTCNLRQHELKQYRVADPIAGTWAFVGHTVFGGTWSDSPLDPGDPCQWPDLAHGVSAADISLGVETVRFVAHSLDQSLTPPVNAAAWFHASASHGSDPDCDPDNG